MPELTGVSLDAFVDAGVLAYRERDFKKAITELTKVLDAEPRHWRAKLYLAMSFYHSGEVFTAYRHFSFLQDNCNDPEIRAKAETAIKAMSAEMEKSTPNASVRTAMPEMTCTFKKPDLKKPIVQDVEDGSDLEWSEDKNKPFSGGR